MRIGIIQWRGAVPHQGNPELITSEELTENESITWSRLHVERAILDGDVTRFTLEVIRSVDELKL